MAMTTGHLLNLEAIKARVDELGLTHADLGIRLGITRQGVTNLMSGRQRVSTDRALRLAAALETHLPEILLD